MKSCSEGASSSGRKQQDYMDTQNFKKVTDGSFGPIYSECDHFL